MRIFLAGGTGALGKRLIPLLKRDGHDVVATTTSRDKFDQLRAMGAEPAVLDALNRDAVVKAVVAARPEVVVHQLTALAAARNTRNIDRELAMTNRLRTEATAYLIEGARTAGARRLIAQSFIAFSNIREGGRIKTEADPLDPDPPKKMRRTLAAIRQLEAAVTSAHDLSGVVLRYGAFYGPGTSIAEDGHIVQLIRQRKFPIFGNGAGVWSFIHIDDAANATRLAISHAPEGIYNIVDDDPAEASLWLPEMARAIAAPSPYRLPHWLGRLAIGEPGMSLMTRIRGSSNAKAKRLLHWAPVYSSWRDGFRFGLAESRPSSEVRTTA
jgi:nucleoside-diphosphate-sugar epimerase